MHILTPNFEAFDVTIVLSLGNLYIYCSRFPKVTPPSTTGCGIAFRFLIRPENDPSAPATFKSSLMGSSGLNALSNIRQPQTILGPIVKLVSPRHRCKQGGGSGYLMDPLK